MKYYAKLEIDFSYYCKNPNDEKCKIDNIKIFLEDDEIFSDNNKMLTDYANKAIESEQFIYYKEDNSKNLIINIISQNENFEHKELIDLKSDDTIIDLILREITFYVIIKNLIIIPYHEMSNEYIKNDILKESKEIDSPKNVKNKKKKSIQSKNDNQGLKTIEKEDEKKFFGFIKINESKNNFNNLDMKQDKCGLNSLNNLLDINTSIKSPALEKKKDNVINFIRINSDDSPNSTSITVTQEKHDNSKEETIINNERIEKLFEEFKILKTENQIIIKENQ